MSSIEHLGKAQWFRESKLGLFIHYGLYSLLGGAWNGQRVRGLSEWIQHNGGIPLSEYQQLTAQWNPQDFDAAQIARQAHQWGMRYICLTAKHHDGFALFKTAVSQYQSPAICGRDLVEEMASACAREGLTFGVYYSQAQDWEHPDGYEAYTEASQKDFRRYLEEKCFPQVRELLTQYGDLGLIWFDTPMGMTVQESEELAALVHQSQPNCLISGRIGNGLGDYITTQDNRIPAYPISKLWEMPATLNHSWGYSQFDQDWRSPKEVLTQLIHILSRGGNYLLNVGPQGNGRIPEGSVTVLDAVGRWIQLSQESLFGTEAIHPYVYEAPDLAFTHRPHHLYIHLLNPELYQNDPLGIPHLTNQVRQARWVQLDCPANLKVIRTLEGNPYWEISLPVGGSTLPILTLDVETEEPDYRQEEL